MDDVTQVSAPEQFKALGHPTRHRLLFALAQRRATMSQLAADLGTNKGNVAHHLKVLADAGLVRVSGTRQVRGGTEQYYERSFGALEFTDQATTGAAFQALAAQIAAADDPFLALRTLRLTPEHASRIAAVLNDLTAEQGDGDDQPRYNLLLGFFQS